MSEEDLSSRSALLNAGVGKGTPTVNLNYLLEIAIQQVFHELTILSELLGKKQDSEKKISLVQFAHSTRMLFVKLLALVKWVKTSKKFESCTFICNLLDQQSQLFVQTADNLVKFSTVDFLLARLPTFQVLPAVDILTKGNYPRIPTIIRDAIVKKKKIPKREQALVLRRLNTVLERRIAELASDFSPRIKQLIIRNGMVKLVVPGEFEASLAVLGEAKTEKWILVNMSMLVDDYEIGYGVELIHPKQMNMVHTILQSRINQAQNPIVEVYKFMHVFALSVQLDALFCQISNLIRGRYRNSVIIEKYSESDHILLLGYWLTKPKGVKTAPGAKPIPQYRLQVSFDPKDVDGGLNIRHFPSATGVSHFDIGKGQMRIEKVLSETFVVRCKERLLRIRKRLEAEHPKAFIAQTGDTSPTLTVLLCDDEMSTSEEHLIISVNAFTGKVSCSVSCLNAGNRALIRELERTLFDGSARETLRKILNRLKIVIMIERYRRSVATLQVRVINEAQMAPNFKKVKAIPTDRICLQFIKEEEYYLIITFTSDSLFNLTIGIYLLWVTEDRVQMLEISPKNKIFSASYARLTRKNAENLEYMPSNKVIAGSYRDLTCAVANIEERILLKKLCEELKKKNIPNGSMGNEDLVGGMVVNINNAQTLIGQQSAEFFSNVGRCCLRIDNRVRTSWPFECCMLNIPLVADVDPSKQSPTSCTWVQEVNSSLADTIGDQVIDRLSKYCSMYNMVRRFSIAYKAHYNKFCSVEAFTFHKLLLVYGEERDQLMILSFRPKQSGGHDPFSLNFGQTTPRRVLNKNCSVKWKTDNRWNPHSLLAPILKEKLNRDGDLVALVEYLISTTKPLSSLALFSRIRFQSYRYLAYLTGMEIQFPLKLKFCLHTISDTEIRLTYDHMNIAFMLLSEGSVGIRDASLGRPLIAGLREFFTFVSEGKCEIMSSDEDEKSSGQPAAPSPAHPKSLPPNPALCASPLVGSSQSVPPPSGTSQSPLPPPRDLQATYDCILVDHLSLQKACQHVKLPNGLYISPMEEFLFSLSFIRRATSALRSVLLGKTTSYISNCQIDEVRLDALTCSFPTINRAVTARFHLCIDPATFKLKLAIDYVGDNCPPPEQVEVFKGYFEQVVVRLNNELAMIAFLNMCRSTSLLFTSFAHIITEQQMGTRYPCSISLNLVYSTPGKEQPNKRSIYSGVLIDPNTNNTLIVVYFRSRRTNQGRSFKLLYMSSNNQLREVVDDTTGAVVAANAEAKQTGECPLWKAVCNLADFFCRQEADATTGQAPAPALAQAHAAAQ